MTVDDVVVIGVGNRYRRDDGVGPAVADACAARNPPGVRVVTEPADPTQLLDAWTGMGLAVLVDAAVTGAAPPGSVRSCRATDFDGTRANSSHGVDIAAVIGLGRALDRLPGELVVVCVEAAETGNGPGLTPRVAAAVPGAVDVVLAEITARRRPPPIPVPRTPSR